MPDKSKSAKQPTRHPHPAAKPAKSAAPVKAAAPAKTAPAKSAAQAKSGSAHPHPLKADGVHLEKSSNLSPVVGVQGNGHGHTHGALVVHSQIHASVPTKEEATRAAIEAATADPTSPKTCA